MAIGLLLCAPWASRISPELQLIFLTHTMCLSPPEGLEFPKKESRAPLPQPQGLARSGCSVRSC